MAIDKSKFNIKSEWRKFGFVLAGFFLVAGGINWFKGHGAYPKLWGLSVLVLVIALVFPVLLKPIYIGFLYLGEWLGWLMTRIILSVLYYVILTPLSLISKLTGKTYLTMRPDKNQDSYWNEVTETAEVSHYDNQY